MNKFFFATGILALLALISGSVEANGKSGARASGAKGTQHVNQTGMGNSHVVSGHTGINNHTGDIGNAHYGKSFTGMDGRSYQYTHCPSYLRPYCHQYGYGHWSHYCWHGSFGCCGYYCPTTCGWFYWYEPFCCYLPVQYIETYRPVQVAPVSQVVNVNTNVNGNAAPAGPPALPVGASAVPAGFTPPLVGKQ
jgi:hypothetical protein